jgi:GMP synthase (glutamine-hydrolysing)
MDTILIIDYGSQYNKLISRRIRELGVFSKVVPFNEIGLIDETIKGIILSGGPNSVYDDNAPYLDQGILDQGIPILGICYGMQLLVKETGGMVQKGKVREYGKNTLKVLKESLLTKNLSDQSTVWMSHGDEASSLGEGFKVIGTSDNSIAMIEHEKRKLYGVQFHPEVTHSTEGLRLIENFVLTISNAKPDWNMEDFIEGQIKHIKETVKADHVILGLSGGVDSSVAAALIAKAINKQLTCIFVDTGLLRKDEAKEVLEGYGVFKDLNIVKVDAKDTFYEALKGVSDPEDKRKIIGRVFFEVFEQEKAKYQNACFLAQGTIYPDVIESISVSGPSHTIKSHHNVGGLPAQSTFELLEPLRELFKDEVREVGVKLGLPKTLVFRHPFPGPGLGVRILGAIDEEKVRILQEADAIFINALRDYDYYDKVSQAFVVLLPVKSVGVMGDKRTYQYVANIRSVDTTDFMTATVSRFSFDFLDYVSTKIINEVDGINRVVYDITSKPPGTIEWE